MSRIPSSRTLEVRIFRDYLRNGCTLMVVDPGMQTAYDGDGAHVLERGEAMEPMTILDDSQCQILIDDLWRAGIRPTEGKGAGQLTATEAHLGDMRKIADEALKVCLNALMKSTIRAQELELNPMWVMKPGTVDLSELKGDDVDSDV